MFHWTMLGMTRARRRAGFTVTELMVAVAIAAILLASGVPLLRDMIVRQRLRTAANELFAAIDLTRSQAIARGARVLLMPADTDGSDWTRGWLVFVDHNGSVSFDDGDELIFRQGPVSADMTIRSAFSSSLPPSYLAYNGAGRSCSASNSMAARWGTLSVALESHTRHIKINMLGRARICDPDRPGQAQSCTGVAGD